MIAEPGGYLSAIASQWPNPSSDVIAATRLYWTPTRYAATPCWDGTQISMLSCGQLPLDLTSAQAANQVCNVGMINPDGSGPMLATSPAWASITSPGDGAAFMADFAGGTWLPVNMQTQVMRNGANTYTIPAGQAVWIGTICPAGAGAVTVHVACGPGPRRRDIWNLWNQEDVELILSDPTFNWPYSSRHPNYANGNPNNYVAPLTGRPQRVEGKYHQSAASTNGTNVITGIQYDGETYATGQLPQTYPGQTKPGAFKFRGTLGLGGRNVADEQHAMVTISDLYGAHSLRALHWIESYSDQYPGDRPSDPAWSADFYGNEHSMRLSARYKA